jgi:uncharacterized protein
MATVSQQLLDLQGIDLEIGRLQRQVDQLTAAIGDQMKVKAADYAIKQAEDAHRKVQAAQRDREYELSTIEARIKEHTERLYSGKGSPRDLQALQTDIAHDKERREQMEEQALAAMEATEKAKNELERVQAAVRRVLSEASAGKERQVTERDAAQTELVTKRAQRDTLLLDLPANALSLYERLRQRTPDGLPVSEVIQSRCSACQDNVPSTDIQRAKTGEIVQCSACHRILHVR